MKTIHVNHKKQRIKKSTGKVVPKVFRILEYMIQWHIVITHDDTSPVEPFHIDASKVMKLFYSIAMEG